jgi:hypothetical protein
LKHVYLELSKQHSNTLFVVVAKKKNWLQRREFLIYIQ